MRFITLLTTMLLCVPSMTHAATKLAEDQFAVRILAYFMVGQDDTPDANITIEQFNDQMRFLKEGGYNVISLEQMNDAYTSKTTLPENSVAITFDGGDKSILTNAAPILEAHQFPYTIFIATDREDANDPRYLNWENIKALQKSGFVTIGLHPQIYGSIGFDTPEIIRKSINNATARLRDEMSMNASFFSYPFGEYTKNYQDIIKDYNFSFTFGQNSGVAYNDTKYPLPRFTMTEDFAQLDRFQMILNSLPLPANNITPNTSIINTSNPAIGFSVPEALTDELQNLSCFASGQEKPEVNILGNRVEIRLNTPIIENRFRVNCTLPVIDKNIEETTSWRWFGQMYSVNDAPL